MSEGRWQDLKPRVLSGLGLIAIGLGAVWLGGHWFHALIGLITGLMVWELVGMLDSGRTRSPLILGLAAGCAVVLAIEVPVAFGLPLLLLPAMLGLARMESGGVTYAVFTALILLAGYGMMQLRDDFGLQWMLWLILVVVVTDIAGYFAGRTFGGPKLWPRVSPKKTWSGATAGWAGAALVGLLFSGVAGSGNRAGRHLHRRQHGEPDRRHRRNPRSSGARASRTARP